VAQILTLYSTPVIYVYLIAGARAQPEAETFNSLEMTTARTVQRPRPLSKPCLFEANV